MALFRSENTAQYIPPEDDTEIFAKNRSNYGKHFKQAEYGVWSMLNDNVKNTSLVTFIEEINVSTESYTLGTPLNGTSNYFPLAKLLEESWWNVLNEKFLRHGWERTVILIIVYTLIFVIGVIGNCLAISVVLLRPKMKTVTNMFIMNLAVADLFVIIFCVGPTLLANIFQPWILGSFMCKGVAYVQGVSVCASAYSLVAISLDRCYAVYRPLDRYRGISKSQALKAISLIWITALSLILPWAVIFNIRISDKDGLAYCNETWSSDYIGNVYFLFANLILCYGLPLVTISVSNAIVWCHISNRNVPQESVSAANIVKRVHQRARENVRKMLSIVTFTFLISWLPLYILVSRVKFATSISESELHFIEITMPFAQWLGSCNSSVNPIIYAFLNRKFREEFHSLLPSWVHFVQVNKMMGMGSGGYGVNVSIRNSSKKFRSSEYRFERYRNCSRILGRRGTSSTVLISSFHKSTKRNSTKPFGRDVTLGSRVKHAVFIANPTTGIFKTKSTSGNITDL